MEEEEKVINSETTPSHDHTQAGRPGTREVIQCDLALATTMGEISRAGPVAQCSVFSAADV